MRLPELQVPGLLSLGTVFPLPVYLMTLHQPSAHSPYHSMPSLKGRLWAVPESPMNLDFHFNLELSIYIMTLAYLNLSLSIDSYIWVCPKFF